MEKRKTSGISFILKSGFNFPSSSKIQALLDVLDIMALLGTLLKKGYVFRVFKTMLPQLQKANKASAWEDAANEPDCFSLSFTTTVR